MPAPEAGRAAPSVQETDSIVGLIARLPKGSAMRQLALEVVRGDRPDTLEPFTSSLLRPHARRWRERAVAAWALGHAAQTEDERAVAVGTLMDELEEQHQEPLLPRMLRGMAITSAVIISGIILAYLTFGPPGPNDEFMLPFVVLHLIGMPFGVPAAMLVDRNGNDRVRAEAACALGHLRAVDSLGPLAAALFDRSPMVREAAEEALVKVIPGLTPADYGRFGESATTNLARALYHPNNQLVFRVLQAIEKVGTSHAIPYVERMVHQGRTVRLKDAASQVLETLRARQEREAHKDILLRSASTPDDPAFLLRPARDSEGDSQTLLRTISDEA